MTKQQLPSLIKAGKPKLFYGYIIVVAAFIIQAITWGMYSTYGVFFNPLLTEFGWLRATIAGAASLSFLLSGPFNVIAGGLNDRFGPRLVMAACGFFLGLGYLLMSQVNAIWQLYLFYGVIVAIGLSGADVILLSTVARWFVRRRGMASAIIKAGTGFGIMIMPLLASRLIIAYEWRISYIVLGVISLLVIVLLTQFLRRDPAQMQLLPYGEAEANAGSLNAVEKGLSLREAMHTRQFWTMCAVYLAIVFNTHPILTHIVQHAIDLDISATNAANILSIIGGVSIVGRLVMGGVGDRFGNKQAVIICFLVLVAALAWLQLAKELWTLYLFAALYSFSHGGFFAIISPMLAGIFGTRAHGLIFGIVICCGTTGGAVSTLLAGHIFDVTGSYQIAFFILLALAITGLILTTSLRPIIRERKSE